LEKEVIEMPWGMGRWGWMYPPPYAPYGYPYGIDGRGWGYGPTKEQEKQMLQDWQKNLEDELEQVKTRIGELEKK
jgi:hypothetical protein